MAVILYDHHCREGLYPFTETRHVADIRVGIFTIREKWEQLLKQQVILSREAEKQQHDDILIPADFLPVQEDYIQIMEAFKNGETLSEEFRRLKYPWNIYEFNAWAIQSDIYILMNKARPQLISETNRIVGKGVVYAEEGVKMEHCIINTEGGSVFIGRNALVMEGALLRGPVAIGEGAVIKMGACLYGGTTIGPYCVAGGEIKNSILMEYSNKAHEGYLGDSVIGAWCNLGAGTSNSNVKNNAGTVSYLLNDEASPFPVGVKAGLIMGDFSRSAINTSFNTGTIIGVSCNIFGRDFPLKNMPSFTWGNEKYLLEKALTDIANWKGLRNMKLTEEETVNLQHLYYKSFNDEKKNSSS